MYESGALYAASAASTTSGSGRGTRGATGSSASGGSATRRVRVLRLLRPRRVAPAFGFSLRGGREHGAGFFISKVELNSEAHHQGLKVGDQVISVNGYRVEDAVHRELTHYIANQTRLKVKVRNVGMIPVKDKSHEPLTWKFVSDATSLTSDTTTTSSSPTLCHGADRLKEMQISVLVPPKAKLGCGICKGPEWKPGIYVQFVKEHGIARDSGLRPGDQILSCNGVDFNNVQFNEAISVMKRSPRLELRVRPGAGAELVSPESSGYNSSASSAAGGDRSPPAAGAERLAMVTEEKADFKDRLIQNRLKRRTWDSIDFDWRDTKTHSFDAPSDIEPDYDSPPLPNNPHTYENQMNMLHKTPSSTAIRSPKTGFVSNPSNRTIINLTENGATIQCSYDHRQINKTVSDTTQNRRNDTDKKTIVVEVHHNKGGSKITTSGNTQPATVASKDICSETSSISSNTTLSSAIHEEIMRRKMKQTSEPNTPPAPPKKSTALKSVDNEKKKQHDALMDEFKKLHRKMFSSLEQESRVQHETAEHTKEDADRQPTHQLRISPQDAVDGNVATNGQASAEKPPPPPPMPLPQNGDAKKPVATNGHIKDIVKEVRNNKMGITNGTLKRTPTPDYESSNIEALTAKLMLKNSKQETAEVESIESYKMRQLSSLQPKPPSTYFMRAPNGTATMKKSGRPVSITIGEYPSNTLRKEPSKLEFLNGESKVSGGADENNPIGSRLQSELALTLSRSNLRKKTELLDHKLENKEKTSLENNNSDDSDQTIDKNFHKRYGNNILPTAPEISIPKVPAARANSHHISSHIATLASKVTLHRTEDTKNGIKEKSPTNIGQQENKKKITFDHVMKAMDDRSNHNRTS